MLAFSSPTSCHRISAVEIMVSRNKASDTPYPSVTICNALANTSPTSKGVTYFVNGPYVLYINTMSMTHQFILNSVQFDMLFKQARSWLSIFRGEALLKNLARERFLS